MCKSPVSEALQMTTRAGGPTHVCTAWPVNMCCNTEHQNNPPRSRRNKHNLNTTVLRVDASDTSLSKRIVLAAHLKQVRISSNSTRTALVFKTSGKSGYLSILIPSLVFRRRPRRAVTAVKCSRRFRAGPPAFLSSCSLQTCNGLKFLVYAFLDVVAEG